MSLSGCKHGRRLRRHWRTRMKAEPDEGGNGWGEPNQGRPAVSKRGFRKPGNTMNLISRLSGRARLFRNLLESLRRVAAFADRFDLKRLRQVHNNWAQVRDFSLLARALAPAHTDGTHTRTLFCHRCVELVLHLRQRLQEEDVVQVSWQHLQASNYLQ